MPDMVELIIYLEPSSSFKQIVEKFLRETATEFGPTTANKYSCHVTMTGFFHVKSSHEQNTLKELLEEQFGGFKSPSIPHVSLHSLLVRDDHGSPKHLILPVTATQAYHTAISNLAEKCTSSLRIKKINHISLAYWDESSQHTQIASKWVADGNYEKMQQEANVYFQEMASPDQWDVVLYNRVSRGNLVGEHHVFEELGRWHCA